MQWRAYIYDESDVFIGELPIEGLSIQRKKNAGSVCSIRCNYSLFLGQLEGQGITVQNVVTAGMRIVRVYYDTTLEFAGFLSDANIQKYDYDVNINLTIKSWLYYFEKRFITKSYVGTGDGDIAWDVIDTLQSVSYGDIGITAGSVVNVDASRNRTFRDDDGMKAIMSLCNTNVDGGFEFEITHDKVFTTATRIGSDRPEIVFDKANIATYQVNYHIGLDVNTRVYALGGGQGESQIVKNADASNALKTKWYLQESKVSHINVEDSEILQAHANEALALSEDSSFTVGLTVRTNNVPITTYDVGDSVKVTIDGVMDELVNIEAMDIQVQGGVTTAKLDIKRQIV